MRFLIVILSLLFIYSSTLFAAENCAKLFAAQPPMTELKTSIDQSIRALAELRLDLDLKKAQGQSSIELTALGADYISKEKELADYLIQKNIMTHTELLARVKIDIQDLQNRRAGLKDKHDNEKEIEKDRIQADGHMQSVLGQIDGKVAVFNRVNPGRFKMGDDESGRPYVTITKPYDLMATPTTQIIWENVGRLSRVHLKRKFWAPLKPSPEKGDTKPVAFVSYNEVQKWIKALNQLSQMAVPELKQIIPQHKPGDVYRLPTEAEWEFVIHGRGTPRYIWHYGAAKLDKYVWYDGNSDFHSHPVGLKEPIIINGKYFYDLNGNVKEWVQDWYAVKHSGGKDPQGPTESTLRVIRNGSWRSDYYHIRSTQRSGLEPDEAEADVGFRLARDVTP